jgi:hypothetical protein
METLRLWDVEDPTLSRQSAHRWQLDFQPYAPTTIYSEKDLLVLISARGWIIPRSIVWLEGIDKLKEFIDLIGTQTCYLLACSIPPQPFTLPCAPKQYILILMPEHWRNTLLLCSVASALDPLRPYSQISRPEPLLFCQVAPQLYSRGWVDPVPDPLFLRKSGSIGNWTLTSRSVARNSDH